MYNRSTSLDLLRVIAISMMMVYHLAYDLEFFYGYDIGVLTGGWYVLERTCATLFLLLAGISFALSWNRNPDWKRSSKRGLKVLVYAFIVSAVTYIFDPSTYVRFGILHLIGVGTLLLPLFVSRKHRAQTALSFGAAIFLLTFNLEQGTASSGWLIPLGFTPPGFTSIDYFPLLPWFSVMLYGLGLGFLIAGNKRFLSFIPDSAKKAHPRIFSSIEWISKRSLALYMLHQPFFLGILYLVYGH